MRNEKHCTGSFEECINCGKYYSTHFPHYELGYSQQVSTVLCFYGTGGTFDGDTGRRLESD